MCKLLQSEGGETACVSSADSRLLDGSTCPPSCASATGGSEHLLTSGLSLPSKGLFRYKRKAPEIKTKQKICLHGF